MLISRQLWRALTGLILRADARDLLSVLIFHRVLAEKDPLRPGEPDAREFEDIIRFLSRHFTIMPLYDAVAAQQAQRMPGYTLAITFDDGYADNLEVALPILRRYETPATFFVTSGYLDSGMMWNDKIVEAVRSHEEGILDARPIGFERYDVSGTSGQRHAIRTLISALKYRSDRERQDKASWIFANATPAGPQKLMLSESQLRELADDALAEIGGHTVTHPILSRTPSDEAYREIVDGKRDLERIIGKQIRCFAYPNGVPEVDYGVEHVGMVADAGFELAVSTSPGAVRRDSHRLQLPRFTPWDRRMSIFGLRLLKIARAENPVEAH